MNGEQCDQMLEIKVAQFLPKVTQNVFIVVLIKIDVFKIAQKVTKHREIPKIAHSVTLITSFQNSSCVKFDPPSIKLTYT